MADLLLLPKQKYISAIVNIANEWYKGRDMEHNVHSIGNHIISFVHLKWSPIVYDYGYTPFYLQITSSLHLVVDLCQFDGLIKPFLSISWRVLP